MSEIYKEKENKAEYEKFKNKAKELLIFISADEIAYSATIYPEKIQEKVIAFYTQHTKKLPNK
ncbi:hypothetical protein [Capnocytophaga catalasegens]|uniref:Uncharacterized protein n=1 Tax=Capnocytophaga catalasegens TaxID=1004260 RepID=A0AAV5ATG9_9FLAO|nr:hypothetical protein [Capnocytophaga catalasegens]GIZ14443.1 hypothetical protein RCZ03_04440 [Capnocytophaga catalasegens]GJM50639.1 hypothetical protein RCZ15_16120 [Capnocytophaga catalasegens]GJM53376.1 hypothetical protein RCZ16_16930 [Capnocytophaga catalasegens]